MRGRVRRGIQRREERWKIEEEEENRGGLRRHEDFVRIHEGSHGDFLTPRDRCGGDSVAPVVVVRSAPSFRCGENITQDGKAS